MNKNPRDETTMEAVKSCGNVFADLGVPNAEEELAKSELAFSIRTRVRSLGLSQAEAANRLGTDQAKVSLLMSGKVAGFTFDRIVRFLNTLEMDVRITVAPASARKRGNTTVTIL